MALRTAHTRRPRRGEAWRVSCDGSGCGSRPSSSSSSCSCRRAPSASRTWSAGRGPASRSRCCSSCPWSGRCPWASSAPSSARRSRRRAATTSGSSAPSASTGASSAAGGRGSRTFVDSAVYIALIRDYLASWLDLSPNLAWLLGVAIIAVFAYLNIRGLNVIAVSSVVMTIIILTPFVVMTVLGFANWHGVPWQPFAYPGQSVLTSIGYALAVGMWMYSGYDSMSVLAGEVEEPRRVIPRGLMIAMPLVVISYFVPTLAALGGVGRWDEWTTEGGITSSRSPSSSAGRRSASRCSWPPWSATWPCTRSTWRRAPRPAYAMAADHLLPKVLTRTHPKYGTPWVSIVFLAAVNALLVRWGFQTLIVIDVFLMMFYYILIFVAAVVLRVQGAGARATVPGDAAAPSRWRRSARRPSPSRSSRCSRTAGTGSSADWPACSPAPSPTSSSNRCAGPRRTGPARLRRPARQRAESGAPGGAPLRHCALKSVGLFSHESVENRQSALGGWSTAASSPWCVASSTPSGPPAGSSRTAGPRGASRSPCPSCCWARR